LFGVRKLVFADSLETLVFLKGDQMEKKTEKVIAYKQGSQWIVSAYSAYYDSYVTNPLPYYIQTKADVRNYFWGCSPELTIKFQ
jgi:hypothetical protein